MRVGGEFISQNITIGEVKTCARWINSIVLVGGISLLVSQSTSAQIFEIREYHGRRITCGRSGLMGWSMPCGADQGYAEVFIGSILSVVDVSKDEKQLRLRPDEVFFGVPGNEVTVTTSQGDCLPEAHAVDRWLFFLQKDEKSGNLVLSYGSPSGPEAEVSKTIDLLRRLAVMQNSGVITGNVTRIESHDDGQDYIPASDHRLVAKRKDDGSQYKAFTDSKGDYEFQDLPVGTYELTSNTIEGLWAEEGSVKLTPKSCSRVNYALRPDGRISGRVRTSSGLPAPNTRVVIVPANSKDSSWNSVSADEQGHLRFRGVKPGRYLIGVGIGEQEPGGQSHVYYPGVSNRSNAMVIELGLADQRENIDFDLPISIKP